MSLRSRQKRCSRATSASWKHLKGSIPCNVRFDLGIYLMLHKLKRVLSGILCGLHDNTKVLTIPMRQAPSIRPRLLPQNDRERHARHDAHTLVLWSDCAHGQVRCSACERNRRVRVGVRVQDAHRSVEECVSSHSTKCGCHHSAESGNEERGLSPNAVHSANHCKRADSDGISPVHQGAFATVSSLERQTSPGRDLFPGRELAPQVKRPGGRGTAEHQVLPFFDPKWLLVQHQRVTQSTAAYRRDRANKCAPQQVTSRRCSSQRPTDGKHDTAEPIQGAQTSRRRCQTWPTWQTFPWAQRINRSSGSSWRLWRDGSARGGDRLHAATRKRQRHSLGTNAKGCDGAGG
ncbi:hypothetical protein H310_10575, partial [Aphanomyces invadans]